MTASLITKPFGVLPTGETVEVWTLAGAGGLVLEVITLGGIVTRLLAPDREERLEDVVLGFADLPSYLNDHPYFGAIVGRVAGRVTAGKFNLDGKIYQLALNESSNHLHGGYHGFDKKLWSARATVHPTGAPSIHLTYRSLDGEEGYPGNVDISVSYTVTDDNSVLIETEAQTDQPTPFNLTHHSYFNLAGEDSGTILDHELQVEAEEYVSTNTQMALSGRLEPVSAFGNDFRTKRELRSAIPMLFENHGDLYRILRKPNELVGSSTVFAARLEHRASGRRLDVYTTEPYLQIYTGSSLNGTLNGKTPLPYLKHSGICLECHGYPDGVSFPELGDITLRPGRSYQHTTKYAFSIIPKQKASPNVRSDNSQWSYAATLPKRRDFRIAILGSGFIVDECHLPSYRKAGYNVVGIASRNVQNAERLAEQHNLSCVYETYRQIINDPTIEILDLAIPPQSQLELIRAACERGTAKGILAQKPLALNYEDGAAAVRLCEMAGITLCVNQNMRYDPTVYAAKHLLQDGFFGAPIFATIDMRGIPHWQPWQAETGSATIKIMSIHHLDCMRNWFGEPERVFCSTRTDPRTTFGHTDGICTTVLEYSNGLRCVIIDDVWTGPAKEGCPSDLRIEWRIEGLDGLAIGDLGWCKSPYTTPSTMRYAHKGDGEFHKYHPAESWFPDAFSRTMGQLMTALDGGNKLSINGRDNLRTIALMEAALLSAKQHRLVSPKEIIDNFASGRRV